MIDTISILLPSEAALIPSLERVRVTQSAWGESITGNFRNLLIKQMGDFVSITGSLEKFTGTKSLIFSDSREAINNLCQTFSFDPAEAKIRRIDFAKTIQTKFIPKMYYPFLGSHRSYFRSPFKNSLNYSNSIRTLTFYDKAKEQGIKGNLLRYEQRYFKPETVFKEELYLANLLSEDVYKYFLANWQTDYTKIHKIRTIIPMEYFKRPSDFFAYLIAIGAVQIGDDLLNNQIRIAQRSGKLSKQNAKRIRDKIGRLAKAAFFETNELIQELDNEILKDNF